MRLPRIRRIVQLVSLPVAYAGFVVPGIVHFVWPSIHCYACPLSVWICPVGALQNFVKAGRFPFFVVGTMVGAGVGFGRAVCGWICPFGLLNDLLAGLNRLKTRLGAVVALLALFLGAFSLAAAMVDLRAGVALALTLFFALFLIRRFHLFKYLFLGATIAAAIACGDTIFCKTCAVATFEASIPYALSPNASIPVKPFGFPFLIHIGVGVLAVVGILWARRFWCRYLCPFGAIMGLTNRFSALRLHHDPEKCAPKTCKAACLKSCPMGVTSLTRLKSIDATDCIRCGDCVAACPNGALTLRFSLKR